MDDRRSVSKRWLLATVSTGLFGMGLMGAAVFGVHDGERNIVRRPQFAVTAKPTAQPRERQNIAARKGDRLIRSADLSSARQTFKTPTTVRAGGREVIKVKAFARLATPLALLGGAYQEDIPPFNPLKLLTDAGSDRGFEATPPTAADDPDAEVALTTTELQAFTGSFIASELSEEEVKAQVRETAAIPRRQVPAIPAQMLLARTMQTPLINGGPLAYAPSTSPFSQIVVRMVEENVSNVPKLDAARAEQLNDERVVTVTRGQTLEQVIRAQGGTQAQARAIVAALKQPNVVEGQRIRLLFAPLVLGGPPQLLRVMIYGEDKLDAIAAMTDREIYVAVAPPAPDQPQSGDDDEDDDGNTGLALYNSIYETALKNDVPRGIIDDVIRILSADSDTDFQRSASGGDSLDLFYTDDEDESREVLYVALSAAGETKQYYRFTNPDDGSVDYFDENGRSAKKFLMRKPIVEAQLRSGFGMRRHPVLGYSKMHTGIDYANRIGTPILAAGNGVVIKAGWDSGYGKRIEIQHANGYLTTYSHMSGFARNIQAGTRVRQGAVIGYLGNTGLSTGPHLHYEVIANDRYVDPLRIRIPRGRELDGRMLAEFKRERERIDALRTKSPAPTRVGALIQR
jgi:murein DD-endopeptidase MepM/ murein hydrolase activator NlpD